MTQQVQHQLERLIARDLALLVPRQSGQREDRYMHALGEIPTLLTRLYAARGVQSQAEPVQQSLARLFWELGLYLKIKSALFVCHHQQVHRSIDALELLIRNQPCQALVQFSLRLHTACGVVTASAGNHAQGLALAAKVLGVKATIVMPKTTPEDRKSVV